MKRPTQLDVARIAGVSRATVSFVVNGLTDGRVPISEDTRRQSSLQWQSWVMNQMHAPALYVQVTQKLLN